jgi:hypothetical protein
MITAAMWQELAFSHAGPPFGATRRLLLEVIDDLWWAEIREWDHGASRLCQICQDEQLPCNCLLPPETAAMCWRAGDPIYPYIKSTSEQSTREQPVMIERIAVNAATCDADHIPGFAVTVVECDGANVLEHTLFACRRPHIAKAVRVRIGQASDYSNGEADVDVAGLTQADVELR